KILQDYPSAAITPEAVEAAKKGESPFGPPPLIERRSGWDRRSGTDRRGGPELVFRNSRFGGERRDAEDRRKSRPLPEIRCSSTPVEDAIGNPSLKAMGWLPESLRHEEQGSKLSGN